MGIADCWPEGGHIGQGDRLRADTACLKADT